MILVNTSGVLLVNLGTPDSLSTRALRRYLTEFLTDPRVISLPWIFRQILVRGIIIPKRLKESLGNYRSIWTEKGSPLLVNSQNATEALQKALGPSYHVALGMRYGHPSIREALHSLRSCDQITVLPLFPQYAGATTGSTHAAAMRELASWKTIPTVTLLSSFPTQPAMIQAFAEQAKPLLKPSTDHILLSFHGLPVAQVEGVPDKYNYEKQCLATAAALKQHFPQVPVTHAFQSRLGKEPWLQPYTQETVVQLASQGVKQLLVLCPSFVADCVETLQEIGMEYRHQFLQAGGEELTLAPSLNNHPLWIQALKEMVAPASGLREDGYRSRE